MNIPIDGVLPDTTAATAATWQPPAISGTPANRRYQPIVADLDEIQRAAWDAGFAQGSQAGQEAGEKKCSARLQELDSRINYLQSLLQAMVQPLAQLDAEVEQQLVTLACTIAKHIIRRELKLDPTQVIAIVRETVSLLPISQQQVRVHLHPQDAAIVRERLAEPMAEQAWTIVEDPVLARGGCRVSTITAQIDARLETQLATVFSHLMGDERTTGERE